MKSKPAVNIAEKNSKGPREIEPGVKTSDFDGHTDFHKMTFTEKLEWLSEAVVSVYMLAKDNPGAGCNSLFKAQPHKAAKSRG